MEEKIKKIMSELFSIEIDVINDDTSMKTLEVWDSLKHMELITSIEESFPVSRLEIDEIIQMTNFKKIKEILSDKLKGKNYGA
jgi:acyl carrier protein